MLPACPISVCTCTYLVILCVTVGDGFQFCCWLGFKDPAHRGKHCHRITWQYTHMQDIEPRFQATFKDKYTTWEQGLKRTSSYSPTVRSMLDVVLVPDTKPTTARIAFNIARYTGSAHAKKGRMTGRWGLLSHARKGSQVAALIHVMGVHSVSLTSSVPGRLGPCNGRMSEGPSC